jgi:hypothetical protein
MKRVLLFGPVLLSTAMEAWGAEPFMQIETGMLSRDVVEQEPAIEGFTVGGSADSIRLIATAGSSLSSALTVHIQGWAADHAIDEFKGFDSMFNGACGGGVWLNLVLPPYRDRRRMFVEGSRPRTTSEDTGQAEFGCASASGSTAATGAQDDFGTFFGADWCWERSGKTALNLEMSLFDQNSFRAAAHRAF